MNAISPAVEPLVRLTDLDEYRVGLQRRLSGEWDEETWTGYRVRFGVYGQKQPGVQMMRIKIPGGVLSTSWIRTLAQFNREFCQGDLHVTTRQDVQAYFVPLKRTDLALEYLYSRGLTTREACGNTLRNMTACAMAGVCPREHTDAGVVAQRLARMWLRHPLVQHMPRKAKVSVSGCATDCAASTIHDLGLIATEKDGKKGFIVNAAGGLGGQPIAACRVLDFVTEDELPTVVETMARLHQRYSDRVNRNAARIKFVQKRFGTARFTELFQEEFARLRGLPQRPWEKLAWREPTEAEVAKTPVGVVKQHDGKIGIIANPTLGLLSSDQMDAIATIVEEFGLPDIRITRDQNLLFAGVRPEDRDTVIKRIEALGNIAVPESPEMDANVVSCPGTTSCRIGITNSQNFARAIENDVQHDESARGIAVRISGCQNACGQHQIGDFGFHGMAKKVGGHPAPHYQIHVGGNVQTGAIGLSGPIVPARHGVAALRLLRKGYAEGKLEGETVRGWAERLKKPGLTALLSSLEGVEHDKLFIDFGEDEIFQGAPKGGGDCAAPFAPDNVLADLANDALIRIDRHMAVGRSDDAIAASQDAIVYASRRVLHHGLRFTKDDEPATEIFDKLRTYGPAPTTKALSKIEAERAKGDMDGLREQVLVLIDTANAIVTGGKIPQDAAE